MGILAEGCGLYIVVYIIIFSRDFNGSLRFYKGFIGLYELAQENRMGGPACVYVYILLLTIIHIYIYTHRHMYVYFLYDIHTYKKNIYIYIYICIMQMQKIRVTTSNYIYIYIIYIYIYRSMDVIMASQRVASGVLSHRV